MWYVFAASCEQQERSVKDLIPESIQLTNGGYKVDLWSVGELLFITNYRNLRAVWKPQAFDSVLVLSKFVWGVGFKSRV